MSMTFGSWSGRQDDPVADNGFNVNNANGATLLRALGLVPEPSGEVQVVLLRSRASGPREVDEGEPWEEFDEGRFVECGRRAGYVNERMEDLLDLCADANRLGHRWVAWG